MTTSERIRLAEEWKCTPWRGDLRGLLLGDRMGDQLRADEEEIARLKKSLVRAANATDGSASEECSSEFLSYVGQEVELCIGKLRAKLAEAEREIAEYKEAIAAMSPGYFRDAAIDQAMEGE